MLKISFAITGINYILKYIKYITGILNYNISQIYNILKNNQINAALMSIRDFFQKHKKILPITISYISNVHNLMYPY